MDKLKIGDTVKAQRASGIHLTAYARKRPDGTMVYPRGTWHLFRGKRGIVTSFNPDADEYGVALEGNSHRIAYFRPFELVPA